ncbi:MAG: hypothetical protein MUE66_09365, partial [Acidimicrobiia bacterium]|nr:hypothetical protein [Acidimicrobiia bacterium]
MSTTPPSACEAVAGIAAPGAPETAVAPGPAAASASADPLEALYLAGLRRRFKNEVNRLTRGAMRERLAAEPDAGDLAFLMSYLYAFHWLRHHVDPGRRPAMLASFRGARHGFLIDLLDQPAGAEAFVRGYLAAMLAPARAHLAESAS